MQLEGNKQARQQLSLAGFLSMLYGGFTEGYIYCPTYDRDAERFKQVFVHVDKLKVLENHILQHAQETDVYLAPGIFREPRVSKDSFAGSNVVWAEFDGNSPDEFKDQPSVIIQSSTDKHTHCYWQLTEPITNAFDLEEINRALTFTMGADASGWDCTQILRPPGTVNHKRGCRVELRLATGEIYNRDSFAAYTAPDRTDEDSIELDHIPDVQDVIFKYPLGTEFKTVFRSNPTEGKRSTAYVYLGYLSAEVGMSDEELYSVLRNFDDRIGKYRAREDRHRRLLDIIERVRLKYPTQLESAYQDSVGRLEIYDVVSFDNSEFAIEWLLPGLLQQAGSMLLSGPPGVGKTQVALNFAFGLAAGSDVLGYRCGLPRRVLFVSCEMGPPDLKYFTSNILRRYEAHKDTLAENLYILPRGEPLYLNTVEGQDALLRMVDATKAEGIIFDSLGSATTKSLTDEEATKGLLDFNDRFRNNTGAFTWFIHHNRKATEANKEPSGLPDVYGSQYITARATSVLSLWPVRKNVLKVRELKIRLAESKDDWYIKRTENLNFELISTEEAKPPKEVKSVNTDTNVNYNRFGI